MTQDKTDDLEIDFSGIKKWFSKKAESSEKHGHAKQDGHTHSEDDISIDFSKVGSFFKGLLGANEEHKGHHAKTTATPDDEAITVDWSKIKDFIIRYQVLLLLFIPIFLAAHFRLSSVDLPITDTWASDTIANSIRANIDAQVQQQYPNIPAAQRSKIVEEQYQQFRNQNKDQLDANIKAQSEFFKSKFQDDTGQTYLIEMDPYTWYRQIKNMLDHGNTGDEVRDGMPWDTHFMAPLGIKAAEPGESGAVLHHWVGYYWHKLWSLFNPDVSLYKTFFYVPVLLAVLSVIPAFFLARRAGGNIAGLFASILVAIDPVFLSRTPAGFSDTDAYNILFPLLIAWIFLVALDTKETGKRYGLSALAGFFVGMYAFAWGGWWYIFDFILAAMGILFVIVIAQDILAGKRIGKNASDVLFPTIVLFIASALSSVFFVTFDTFMAFIRDPLNFISIKTAAHSTLWPNVYTTVAELNAAGINDVVSQAGGLLRFSIAAIGICYLLYLAYQKKENTLPTAVLLTVWILGTVYAASKGVRFVLLLGPGLSVAFGIGVAFLYMISSDLLYASFNVAKKYSKPILFLLFFVLFLTRPLQTAAYTARNAIPNIEDTWWEALTYIKDHSQPTAIITSWWDFGHWFKTVGDRGVTFDGGSQNTPQAHWVGKILLTNSEDQGVGILRMLDCGGNTAFDELQKQNDNHTIASVETLYSLFTLDPANARVELLKRGYSDPDVILAKTHCTPPEAFFIVSEDMVGKSGVWAHFGSWNFSRAKITVDSKLPYAQALENIKTLGYSEPEAIALYNEARRLSDQESNNWIAPWPSFQASNPTPCVTQGDGILCGNSLAVNLTSWDARLALQTGVQAPARLIYWNGSKDMSVKQFNTTNDIAAILIPAGDQYYSILSQDALGASLFTRLFYLEGHGLEHFTKVFDQRTLTGWRVLVYQLDWNGHTKNNPYNMTTYPILYNQTRKA